MGLYTEQLLEREQRDSQLERQADESLFGTGKPGSFQETSIDDAQGMLRYILNQWDIAADYVYGCQTLEEMLDRVLEPKGMMYEKVELEPRTWKRDTDVMLGFLKSGEAVGLFPTVFGYRYLCLANGASGRVGKGMALKPQAVVIYRPLNEDTFTFGRFVRFILKLFTPRDVVPICILMALAAVMGTVSPQIHHAVLGTLLPRGQEAYAPLVIAALLFLMSGAATACIRAAKSLLLHRAKTRITTSAQAAVMARMLYLSHYFFRSSTAGRLSRRVSNVRTLTTLLVNIVFDLSLTGLFSLIYIPQMFLFAPPLAIPALGILVAKLAVSFLTCRASAENEKKKMDISMELSNFNYATIKGMQKIKNSGAQARVYAKWAMYYQKMLHYVHNKPVLIKLSGLIMSAISSLGVILLLGIAVPSGVSRADYISFHAAFALSDGAVKQIIYVFSSFFKVKPLAEQVKSFWEESLETSQSAEYVKALRGSIEFQDIVFSYGAQAGRCLNGVSFSVKKGEKIGIVGESGCGKSTLLKIALGLEKANAGSVLYDGKPLQTLNHRSVRKHVGSVFQFSRVFPGTVRSNIAFTSDWLTEEDIWDAARRAQLEDVIKALPYGLDTEISETATGGFSGGQRQRILIARALAAHPPILLLDEATSALDNVTQSKVLDAIFETKATVLMVAHRLSTVKNCDRIVVLDEGRVAEQGTFEELMARQGKFARLVEKQMEPDKGECKTEG